MTAIVICARDHGLVSIDSFDVQTLTTALAPGTLWVSGMYWGVHWGLFCFWVESFGYPLTRTWSAENCDRMANQPEVPSAEGSYGIGVAHD